MERITSAIEDEVQSLKRVSLFAWFTEQHLTICVADEGKGFDINAQPPISPESPYGRGLMLIRQLSSRQWHTEQGRFYMQFNRHAQ